MSTKMATETVRRCPFCAEEIQAAAVKCRHCGEWLSAVHQEPSGIEAPTAGAATHSALGDSLVAMQHVPPMSPPSTAPATRRVNSLAVASFIFGLVGLVVGSVLALVLGYRAKASIDRSEGAETGRGLAIAGIVLGWVQLALIMTLLAAALITASARSAHEAPAPVGIERYLGAWSEDP
jgi:uncharacterized membrane protein